jgi:predicted ATP-grasp superfamily ATP-dependent carboligase
VTVCESPAELESAFASVRERFGQPLVQEFVPNGGEAGVYALYDCSSDLVGVTVQRRLRTNPPSGGPSTLRETVAAPELLAHARALFDELSWSGVAMAEFRYDARTGEPQLLEINPRLWGSLALSVRAGVDFPAMLYRLATEGECDPALDYEVGVQARQLLGDLGHLLRRPDRVTALREFLSPADVPRTYDVFSRDDPGVAVGFSAAAVAGFLDRLLRGDRS